MEMRCANASTTKIENGNGEWIKETTTRPCIPIIIALPLVVQNAINLPIKSQTNT